VTDRLQAEMMHFSFQDNTCSVLHTLVNQEFLPKMRVLESSFHSMAVFQKQFEAFFTDKVLFCKDFALAHATM